MELRECAERNDAERFDPEQHGHVLFLPVAHEIAAHLGAMFTTE